MNHVFVDQEKNINDAVGPYKIKYKTIIKIANPVNTFILFFLYNFKYKLNLLDG